MTLPEKNDSFMPVRIVVGVTGHRHLRRGDPPVERIPEVLEMISQRVSFPRRSPPAFTVLSPLAEGADRLVVQEMFKIPGTRLEVILPLDKSDYLNDFKSPDSRREFEDLLEKAVRISRIPPSKSRTEAYGDAGRFVVDHCEVLIALWDGRPPSGGGGTAEIVEYARRKDRPLFWVNTKSPYKLTCEPGSGVRRRIPSGKD